MNPFFTDSSEPGRPRKVDDMVEDIICAQRQRGLSYGLIAELSGLSRSTVQYILKRRKIARMGDLVSRRKK